MTGTKVEYYEGVNGRRSFWISAPLRKRSKKFENE